MTSQNDRNSATIKEFRENQGKVGGRFEGAPLLLLSTTGAKTGEARVNPLMYLPDGQRMLVFATRGGAPKSPGWYHNLVANPDVTVEVGTAKFPAKATVVTGTVRDEVYFKQASLYPQFAEYEKRTTRKIPVIALTRER